MNLKQKKVIKLFKEWKVLEKKAEQAEDRYHSKFCSLTGAELTNEVMRKTKE